ncbi:unnamed protein product [Agarophyton chilense]
MSDSSDYYDYNGETVNGRWKVGAFIGGGSFGSVYAARDNFGRHSSIVVKFAGGEPGEEEDTIGCLQTEWRVLRYLNNASPHLRVPIVYEHGSHNGIEYIVMKRLGKSLEEWFDTRDGPVSNIRILQMCFEIFNIVRRLHEKNVLHGDISEGNIVFGRGGSDGDNLYLIDFGNSSVYTSQASLYDLGDICHIMIKMFRNEVDGIISHCELGGTFWDSLTDSQIRGMWDNVEKAFNKRRRLHTPIPPIVRELLHELLNRDGANYNTIGNLFRQAIHAQGGRPRRSH